MPLPPAGLRRTPRAATPTTRRALLAPGLLLALTLTLIFVGAQLARPGLDLAATDPAASRALIRLHGEEQNATDSFRWSEPLTGVFMYGFDGRPAIATLRLTAPRPAGAPPVVVGARTGEQQLGSFVVGPGWRRYSLLAPTRAAGETALLLETAAYTPPGDPRELGIAISRVRLAPAVGGLTPPPVRLLFLLTLPLLGWLLLRRLDAPPRLALAVGVLLALLAGWAAAEPTAAGYWLPTLGWPVWPALPLLLLAAWPRIAPALAAVSRWRDAAPALGWVGLALALAAVVGMRLGLPWPAGMTLLALGVWAALGLVGGQEDRGTGAQGDRRASIASDSFPPSPPSPLPLSLSLLAILAIALLLRFVNLDGQPAGLWRDESRHGMQALRIWSDPSYRPIYVVEGADLPALLFYLMAPVLGLLGPHAWSVRLVSALAGALTPLALFWAGAPLVGRRAALIAAALLAWASWGLSMSRWAFPATLDHLLVLTAVGLIWRCAPSSGPRAVAGMGLAGLLGGLAVYAYHTGRVAPLALVAVAAIRLGPSAAAWRRAAPGLAAAAMVGALVIAPLAAFILGDLEGYNRRVGTVSILDSNDPVVHTPVELLLRNLSRYALMFHVQGDSNGRHHLPDAPMLDPVAGLLLALGAAVALTRLRRSAGIAAVLALGLVELVPGLFSGNAPHAMRSLGTLAPALLLAGLALAALWPHGQGELSRLRQVPHPPPFPLPLLLTLSLFLSLAFNAWLYFGVMRVEPAVYGEFDLVESAIGRVAAAPASVADPELRAVRVFMPEPLRASDTVRFLTWGQQVNGYTGAALPDGAALLLLPGDATPEQQAEALAALGPNGAALGAVGSYPGGEQPLALAFGRGAAAARLLQEVRP